MNQLKACRFTCAIDTRPRLRLLVGVALLLLASGVARGAEDLRYGLQAGDLLYYECQTEVHDETTGAELVRSADQVRIWCVARTSELLTLLLVREREIDGQTQPTAGLVLQLDAFGRRQFPPATRPHVDAFDDVLQLLPVLPLGAQHAREYRTPPDRHQRVWYVREQPAEPPARRFDVVVEEPAIQTRLLQQEASGRYVFDEQQGLLSACRFTTHDRQAQRRYEFTGQLRERAARSAAWAERRAAECTRYLRALRVEAALLQKLQHGVANVAETRTALDRHWAAFQSELDRRALSPLVAVAEGRRQRWQQRDAALQARAYIARHWWAQPARPWTLQDAAGYTHTSEDFRTGVVVECFWSSRSRGGLSALRGVEQLQSDLRSLPLKFVAYNMDPDWVRARRAADAVSGDLPHLLGAALWATAPPIELPLVRVLDRDATVRGVWVGWPPPYDEAAELARELVQARAHHVFEAQRAEARWAAHILQGGPFVDRNDPTTTATDVWIPRTGTPRGGLRAVRASDRAAAGADGQDARPRGG